jgi:hypothetical protein
MKKLLVIVALCASSAFAQQSKGTLKGQVLDELGGAIVGATVVAVDAAGVEKTATTNDQGIYTLSGLVPGKYTVRASTPGFAPYENTEVQVVAGRTEQLNITLNVAIQEQKVTVNSDNPTLSTEPENNAGAVVLKGSDLESLPDDPDDLAAALQALAGPSAGPNGGQIFIDGFSSGRLPPRASIREIRINSNPFSSEYDRLGFGRIEILTKPGSDRFRGQVFFNFNDDALNSRNPFAPNRPAHQSRQYGGNIGGPIVGKKASFFFDFEKRDVDDAAVITATILDSNLNIVPFSQTVPIPNRRTTFSPRIDYQLNANNTLVGRYDYTHVTNVTGVGGFSLASRKYDSSSTENEVQLTETAVISKTIVNETRFQFERQTSDQNANNTVPTINVSEAFIGGGSQVGMAFNTTNRSELTNITSLTKGAHSLKVGGRLRYVKISDISPQNFGGTFTFAGSRESGHPIITSIESYRLTLLGLQQGLPPAEIRASGGGASQFSIAAGKPEADVSQWDFGGFVQDDWKLRPNLTLNLGLRYENQGNISSNLNFAPRVGFAWSPGGGQPKTVVRGGFGIFYDRVRENLTLQANRLNGVNQQQFVVTNPDFFPVIPSIEILEAFRTPVSIYQLEPNIQAPYTMQGVISVEHQLPHNLTVAASYIAVRTLHLLRARAINAPLPGTFIPGVPNSGVHPLGTTNNVFEYESSGRFNQNQFIVNVSNRLSRNSTLNAFYVLSHARSDTDGSGTFPANSYDLSTEYGASSQDVRHRFVMTGSFRVPWGISLNPFLILSSGRPFNITIGRDLNGDILFTERPAFATDLTRPGVVVTKWGTFDPNPIPGEQIIPRNLGRGPGSMTFNLRVSKTFGFGGERSSAAAGQNRGNTGRGQGETAGQRGEGQGQRGQFGGMPGMGGPRGGGPGGGPGGGGFGGGGGGGQRGGGFGGGGGAETGKRYNMTLSVNFNNILNHVNLANPVGNLSSSLFGISTASLGGFGGFGGGGFGGGGSPAYNRRIDVQLRFSF